jgi:hypothetical protein
MPDRRPFSEKHPHLKEFMAFLDSLNEESDSGAVLISAAILDDLLERSIESFLLDHKEQNASWKDSTRRLHGVSGSTANLDGIDD